MVQQIIQKSQAYLKATQIASVLPMNAGQPVVGVSDVTQVDDPQIGKTSGYHQMRDTLGIAQVALIDLKTSAFLVRKEGFNPHAFAIHLTGGFDTGEITDQIDQFRVSMIPPSNDHHRPLSGLGERDPFAKLVRAAHDLQVGQRCARKSCQF
jgi:hypothetical protein